MTRKGGQNLNIQDANFNGNPGATIGCDGKKIHIKPTKNVRVPVVFDYGIRKDAIGTGCYHYRKLAGLS